MLDIIEFMEDLELDKEKLDIKELYKLVEDLYNSSVVAEVFCENFHEIAEIGNITPLVRMIHQKIDKAYAMLIDTKPEIVSKSVTLSNIIA